MPEFKTDAEVEAFVANYRYTVAELEKQTTKAGRQEWRRRVDELRHAWRVWQGEDNLHEMAFGEPDE